MSDTKTVPDAAPSPECRPLPERDTTKPAEQQGVFRKFEVRRVDGSDKPGGKHHGCEYFVLDVEHDAHAKAALAAYAESCAKTHPQLSADMVERYGLTARTPTPITPEQREAIRVAVEVERLGYDSEFDASNYAEYVRVFNKGLDTAAKVILAAIERMGGMA